MTKTEYHKIDSIFLRDQSGRILEGEYSRPEFTFLAGNEWLFTEKVDGTNIRIDFDGSPIPVGDEHLHIAGRTDSAQIPPHLLARLIEITRAAPFAEVFGTDPTAVTLYGEGYGAKIQKGGGDYLADCCDFVVFDVRVGHWWLTRDAVDDVARKLGVDSVPEIGRGSLAEAVEMCRTGFPSRRWPGVAAAEGIVARPALEMFDRAGRRIITKVKVKDFRKN